jgi:hypothetical protein
MDSFDLKINYQTYQSEWHRCLDFIKHNCQSDALYQNYISIDLDQFLSFTILIEQGEIISFGGVEKKLDRWGESIARVLTRFWISPNYRTKTLTKWQSNSIKFSPTILKPQLEFLVKNTNIEAAMITREGNYVRSFNEIIRLANTVSENKFIIQEGRFNVCKPTNTDLPCSQLIALSSLKNSSISNILNQAQANGFLKKLQ